MAKPLVLINHITTVEQRLCQEWVGTQGEEKRRRLFMLKFQLVRQHTYPWFLHKEKALRA